MMANDPTEKPPVSNSQEPLEVDPSQVAPYLQAAIEALGRSDWSAAEEAFARGLTVSPRDPRLHGGLALVAIQEQDWERAVAHGRQAVAMGAGSAEVQNNLGWALEQSGREDQARSAYQRAFETDPTRPEPIHHLLRLGVLPGSEGDLEASTSEIETLLRLDLYRNLATALHEAPCEHTWRETFAWADARGAPWGEVVAWLMNQGVHCDCNVLSSLIRLDEHLADSVISGIMLGDSTVMARLLSASSEVKLLAADEELDDADRLPGQGHLIVAQLVDGGARVQIPSQRCHAAVVYQVMGDLLPMLGADAAMVLTVDPLVHLGPRRVWMLGGLAEAEVVGTWDLFDSDGEKVGSDMRLSPIPIAIDTVPLQLPGIDSESLDAAIADAGLSGPVRADPEGGRIWFHSDDISAAEDKWKALLVRLSRWLPEGHRSFATWRKGTEYRLAVLERGKPPVHLELRPSWPSSEDKLDLPLDETVQLLARALFMGPRSDRFF